MCTDTDHDCTGDQVGGRHFGMFRVEKAVHNEAEQPGNSAGEVNDCDWALEEFPLDCVGDLIRLFRSRFLEEGTFFIGCSRPPSSSCRFPRFQTIVGTHWSARDC